MRRVLRWVRATLRPIRATLRPRRTVQAGAYHPSTEFDPLSADQRSVVDAFHELYYSQRVDDRRTVVLSWLGYRVMKCPFDLWTYQEIIVDTRPDLIIECGTRYGGGALFMASIFEMLGSSGRILSIDIDTAPKRPAHPRITYVEGSTLDPAIVAKVRAAAAGQRTMVILDSDHSAEQVDAELAIYPEFVTPGCYLIVDDTNLGGNPVWPEFGPGPMAALDRFLATTDAFTSDPGRERFMLTLNPRGFLRRAH